MFQIIMILTSLSFIISIFFALFKICLRKEKFRYLGLFIAIELIGVCLYFIINNASHYNTEDWAVCFVVPYLID